MRNKAAIVLQDASCVIRCSFSLETAVTRPGGRNIRHYRSYLIDKDGAATALPPFSFESDGAAHDHAIGLLVGQPRAAKLEVWEGSRITLSYSRSVAKTPAELRRLCYLAIAASKRETDPRARRAIAAAAYALAQEAEILADLGNGFANDLADV